MTHAISSIFCPQRVNLKHRVVIKARLGGPTPRAPHRQHSLSLRALPESSEAVMAEASQSVNEEQDAIPSGCSRYTVSLSKPLGLVLEEDPKAGTIKIAEIVDGGNADKDGQVRVGDMLIATNGMTRMGPEQIYGETKVQTGETFVRLQARGERFETIMAAIGSIPGNMKVELEFQRC